MARHVWLLISGSAWAVMMFLLFEKEIRPYFEYQRPPSYRLMLQGKGDPELFVRTIRFGAGTLGSAETLIRPLPTGKYSIESRSLMRMSAFGLPGFGDDRAYLSSEVVVDENFQLASFRMEARISGIPVRAGGERKGDRLKVSFDAVLMKGDREFEFPRDATLSDHVLPFQGGAHLAEGMKWRMKMLDLGALVTSGGKDEMAFTDLFAAVVGREPVSAAGTERMAFKVEVRRRPTDDLPVYVVWAEEDGTVLRQEMTINKLPCLIVLDRRRTMSVGEAARHAWGVQPP